MKPGDLVYPSENNPHQFNKNTKFPWKVHKVRGITVWIEHTTPSGRKVREMWWIGFWQTYPSHEMAMEVKK